MKRNLSEQVKIDLKTIADYFDQEDRAARERQLRTWRKLKLTWEGFANTWYSEVAHDWRVWDEQQNDSTNDGSQSYYDKPINVFRAYLESIIAALSITVPGIECFPDDADNPLDLSTAKAGNKISELIYRHNDASLLWLHALFIFVTEGMTAAYSYPKADEKYGTYDEPKHEESVEESYVCPFCQGQIPDEEFTSQVTDEYMPDDDDAILQNLVVNDNQIICPQCAEQIDPNLEKSQLIVTRLVGITKKAKSRICVEVYGGLVVKVPNYARKQEDIPYLIQAYETHYTNVVDKYKELKDCFKKDGKIGPSGGGMYDPYEQWARLNPQYHGEYPLDTVTVRNCWLRPSSFNVINDQEKVDKLKELFPNGAKVVLVNDQFADACNENLDDCWTLSHNPLSDYLHHDPLGLLLTNVQDITNDLISLILQTVEHGIGQTFADPAVLSFDKYRQTEAVPGGIYPATPKAGKSVSDAFFEVRTATLGQEVLPFLNKIQELGQIVSGALPSLFGGQVEGSKTASEYSMSRAQALQRLQNNWKIFTIWWKTVFGKVIPMYINEVKVDEHSVEKDASGGFINTFIRKAELEGKIGRVELEANENLPITWSQQKDVIMKLFETQNPVIQAALTSPENLPLLNRAIGLDSFIIPGEDDRQKQYEEIKLLINSEPMPNEINEEEIIAAAQAGMPPPPDELPSIPIDPDVDNNEIEAAICRQYLVSAAGRLLKIENEPGYKNVLLHMKAHVDAVNQQMMAQNPTPEGNGSQEKPKGDAAPLAKQDNANVSS